MEIISAIGNGRNAEDRLVKEIEVSELRTLVSLDSESGKLTWRERPESYFKDTGGRYTPERAAKIWNARYAGGSAFNTKHRMGYLKGGLFYASLLAHRVVWALYHGSWPENTIDHINGVKTDNRPCNLRDVTHAENMRNMKLSRANKTGHAGISYRKQNDKYDAHIEAGNGKQHIGSFETMSEAVAARKSFEQLYGFHPNHGRTQGASL